MHSKTKATNINTRHTQNTKTNIDSNRFRPWVMFRSGKQKPPPPPKAPKKNIPGQKLFFFNRPPSKNCSNDVSKPELRHKATFPMQTTKTFQTKRRTT